MFRSNSEAIFAAASLANAEQQDADLYEEDDGDAVIPVGYATSPVRAAPAPPVEQQEEEFLDGPYFGDMTGFMPPDLVAPDSPIDSLEPPVIEDEVRTHTMWKEACAALRWFGTLVMLPLEVQLQILGLLGPTTLLTLRKTCKFGMLIGEQDNLWERLLLRDFPGFAPEESTESKLSIYHDAYNTCIFGEARSIGFPMVHWKFAKNKVWKTMSPGQVWSFDSTHNRVRSPTFKYWTWSPGMNRLSMNNVAINFQPNVRRFSASDRTTHAIITTSTAQPPTMRLNCIFSNTMGWQITGKIPIPLLMVIIFNLDG